MELTNMVLHVMRMLHAPRIAKTARFRGVCFHHVKTHFSCVSLRTSSVFMRLCSNIKWWDFFCSQWLNTWTFQGVPTVWEFGFAIKQSLRVFSQHPFKLNLLGLDPVGCLFAKLEKISTISFNLRMAQILFFGGLEVGIVYSILF